MNNFQALNYKKTRLYTCVYKYIVSFLITFGLGRTYDEETNLFIRVVDKNVV